MWVCVCVCVCVGGVCVCVFSLCVGVCGGCVWVGVCGVCYKAILPDFSPFSDFDLFKDNHKCYPYFWKLVWETPTKTKLSAPPPILPEKCTNFSTFLKQTHV